MSRDIIVGGDPKQLTAYQQTYHWRNKNCKVWAHSWIKENLPGLKVEDDKGTAEVEEVTSVSGDCDLGQRKGKLLTIYDMEVELKWKGVDSEGNEVNGTIKVPEVSHEAIDGLSEYQYEIALTSSSNPSSTSLLTSIRKSFPPILSSKFNSFRPALLAAHPQTSEGPSPSLSGTSTPSTSAAPAPAPPAKESGAEKKGEEKVKIQGGGRKVGNTATVEVTAQLHASAEDLWGLLTDEGRIPMWTRSQAKMDLKPGGSFELFNGNIRGKVESADKPNKLVLSWQPRKPEWPSEHYGTMTMTFNQGSDSTNVIFHLEGVPSGQEKDIEQALDTFYIRGLKQMGLVISTSSRTYQTQRSRQKSSSSSSASSRRKANQPSFFSAFTPSTTTLAAGAIFGLSAILVGIVVSSLADPVVSAS